MGGALAWGLRPKAAQAQGTAAQGTAAPARTLLVVGDSLSAEYGLRRGSGWVALLEERLTTRKPPLRVVNASISGDTTSGGRTRLPALLQQHRPDFVILELGGNDALRGLSLSMTQDNLAAMSRAAATAGAKVTIVGMQVPPNYGQAYTERFAKLFAEVARDTNAAVVPFLLAGVADGPQAAQMFQADRIHPNESAQPAMRDTVWAVLERQLGPATPARAGTAVN